jgi:hypothetical protein
MVEFSVRIDFYRDLEGPKDYVGSALRDGLSAVVLPRVGEHVLGLGPDADAQGGWQLHFFSDHARSSRSRATRSHGRARPRRQATPMSNLLQTVIPAAVTFLVG